MSEWTPIEVAVTLSLYGYNKSPLVRAMRLFESFGGVVSYENKGVVVKREGDCEELSDLIKKCSHYGNLMTELPFPTAKRYLEHALEVYGEEARERCRINEQPF